MQVVFKKAIDSKAPIETQISVITTDKCFHDLQHNYNLLSGNATVVCYTTGPLFYSIYKLNKTTVLPSVMVTSHLVNAFTQKVSLIM